MQKQFTLHTPNVLRFLAKLNLHFCEIAKVRPFNEKQSADSLITLPEHFVLNFIKYCIWCCVAANFSATKQEHYTPVKWLLTPIFLAVYKKLYVFILVALKRCSAIFGNLVKMKFYFKIKMNLNVNTSCVV